MDTTKLKRFAQYARRTLEEQITSKLEVVLDINSRQRRDNKKTVKVLEEQVEKQGKSLLVEQVAYTWFNRFCALRFMDVNGFTKLNVLSPLPGQFQPEILAEAKMGHIDDDLMNQSDQAYVFSLFTGNYNEIEEPQAKAYRLLIVASCHYWQQSMPFLFQKINDYTELLMPDDLLSGDSILAYTREAMTPDVCKDVEVIGWLYQFYISEKKDKVFLDLKKNKKITPENIPAATQLFTPHWIVRYLVENSLGRLWMLNNPDSKLFKEMDYYIKPDQVETDFLKISSPQEIKICDPACGSGHLLTYAFDLLYLIYQEANYEDSKIPELILTHNLHGTEIDDRAAELAGFALMMKARSKYRRFFKKETTANICILNKVAFDENNLKLFVDQVLASKELKIDQASLLHDLNLFTNADNLGALLCPRLDLNQIELLQDYLDTSKTIAKIIDNLPWIADSNLEMTITKLKRVAKQLNYLTSKYHVVIANPPYMGGKGMNSFMSGWVKKHYPDSKSDLCTMFIERNLKLAKSKGMTAAITMQSWMFLSSFEKLRNEILDNRTIISMAHLGTRAFDTIGGEVVATTAFVLENTKNNDYKGAYIRLVDGKSEHEKSEMFKKAITPKAFVENKAGK